MIEALSWPGEPEITRAVRRTLDYMAGVRYTTALEVAITWRQALEGARPDVRFAVRSWIWNVLHSIRREDPSSETWMALTYAFQATIPDTLDDPNVGKFGLLSERRGYKLTGVIAPYRDVFKVDLFLSMGSESEDIPEYVRVFPHPSVGVVTKVWPDPSRFSNERGLKLTSDPLICGGSFTVGLEVERKDYTQITLELDLAFADIAPEISARFTTTRA